MAWKTSSRTISKWKIWAKWAKTLGWRLHETESSRLIRSNTRRILKRFDVLIGDNDKRSYTTPMERDLKLTKTKVQDMTMEQASYTHKDPYQNIIGALLYLSTHTRSNIAYAVRVLSRFYKTSNYRACKAVIRVLIYLGRTPGVGIIFSGSKLNLHAFSELEVQYQGTLSYNLQLQRLLWDQNIWQCSMLSKKVWVLGKMGLTIDPVIFCMDSKSAICLTKNSL